MNVSSERADLGALVIEVRASTRVKIPQHMGRAVQQLCLHFIQQANPYLSADIHDHPHDPKPYAVSGLLRPGSTEPLRGNIAPGERAWLRIVGLRREIVHALDAIVDDMLTCIELDRTPWSVERITWSRKDHRWAGRASYMGLLAEHETISPPGKIAFTFATPTAFRSNGLNIPLPLPAMVFGSLRRQWETLSDVPLPEELRFFIDPFVALSRYQGETHLLAFKRSSKQVGFVGEAIFTVLRSNSYLKRNNEELEQVLSTRRDLLARKLNMLAAFGFYSGVGIKTTTGMGMVC